MGTVDNRIRLDLCAETEDPSLGLKGVFTPRNLVHLQESNPAKRILTSLLVQTCLVPLLTSHGCEQAQKLKMWNKSICGEGRREN